MFYMHGKAKRCSALSSLFEVVLLKLHRRKYPKIDTDNKIVQTQELIHYIRTFAFQRWLNEQHSHCPHCRYILEELELSSFNHS